MRIAAYKHYSFWRLPKHWSPTSGCWKRGVWASRGSLRDGVGNCQEQRAPLEEPKSAPKEPAPKKPTFKCSLAFLSLIFSALPRKTPQINRGFLYPAEPTKTLEKAEKTHINNQGNSLLKANQGFPKNQGTEGQGLALKLCRGSGRIFGRILLWILHLSDWSPACWASRTGQRGGTKQLQDLGDEAAGRCAFPGGFPVLPFLGFLEFLGAFFKTSPFLRARKKGFSFFSCGATSSRTLPKTQPLQVAFSLRERVDLRSRKGRILGKKIAWGRVGRTGQKKGKKDAQKKVGLKLKLSKGFPWLFFFVCVCVCFVCFFQGFSGFSWVQKSLVNLRVFPW